MNIVLIGMKHCGKSTLGKALANRLGCPFFDVDTMIEDTHACDKEEWLSVRDIFSQRGEDYFHKIEGDVVCELYMKLKEPSESHVVALGGRTVMNQSVRELLKGIGTIVYIRLSPDELFRRIEASGVPPFLDEDDPRADFEKVYAHRSPQYETLADLTIDVDGLDVHTAVDQLLQRVEEHTDAG